MTKKKSKFLSLIVGIMLLILLIGVIVRLAGESVIVAEIAVTYQGRTYKKNTSGLELTPGASIDVKLRDAQEDYTVRIYATGSAKTDFAFTVGGVVYSWQQDIVTANGGRGEDFTDAFAVTKTKTGFTLDGGIEKALKDIWQEEEILLPANIPAGDRFRMELTSGKTTLTLGFSVQEPGSVGVEKIELSPVELVF